MKVLIDTSVIVAALVNSHPEHRRSVAWLQKVINKQILGFMSSHSLLETYSVLTSLPLSPKVSPELALELIKKNLLDNFNIITYEKKDYLELIETLSKNNISGGASYDGLILIAAEKIELDKIITLNINDFIRISPALIDKISAP